MRFDELVTQSKIEEWQWRLARIEPFAESSRVTSRSGMRRAIARRMVGLGAWLDGEAVERVAMARRTG